MQQKSAPESTYLFEEEAHHEKTGKKEISSGETLTNLRTDLSRFYRLNQKLRSINRTEGAENPAKTVEKLNRMLKSNGIGGVNGGPESKAYFVTNGKEVVLVANTVAEGKEITSRDAVYEAFAKIDKLLADPFSKALSSYDEGIKSISSEYSEDTNDAFRVMDAGMNLSGSAARMLGFKGWEGGNKSYERRVDGVKTEAQAMGKLFERFYAERLESIGSERINSGNITKEEREELAVLESQKLRFEAVNGKKLSSPPWMTVELTKFILAERKWDSVKNVGRMAGGVVVWVGKAVFESAKFIFWDTPAFVGSYAINKEFRSQVNAAVDIASQSISKYSEGKDTKAMIADFFVLLADSIKKEKAAIDALPQEEQAGRIGEIVGNVLLMLAGPKLAKDFLRSSALRIKSGAEAVSAAKKLGKVAEISKVRTWDDLESFAGTIQKVRGRKDLGGDELRRIVQKLRMGDASIDLKALPKAGGLRETAEALVNEGGYLSDKTVKTLFKDGANWVDSIVEKGKTGYRKGAEGLHKFFPETFSRELSEAGKEFGTLRKVHDVVDDRVTQIRTALVGYREAVTMEKASVWFSDVKVKFAALTSAFAATWSADKGMMDAIAKFSEKIPGLQKTVDAVAGGAEVAKNGVKDVIAATTERTKAVLDVGASVVETGKDAVLAVESKIAQIRDRLPGSVTKTLAFDYGFAGFKTEAGQVRFVRPDGTFLAGADGKALEFRHASQFSKYGAVVANEEGKFGMIGRDGKFLIEPKYDMIRDLSDERKIVAKDGKYMMIGKGADGIFEEKLHYDFITEPHQGRAIGVTRLEDGRELRELIQDTKGSRAKPLFERGTRVSYEIVDDFADDGIAAARLQERSATGKFQWQIIDQKGAHMGMKGTDGKAVFTIEADSPAEALNRFRDNRSEIEFTNNAARAKKAKTEVFSKFKELEAQGVRVIDTGVDGIYRLQKDTPNGILKGFANMKSGKMIPPTFQDAFFSDAKDGFMRVKQDGHWGVLDIKTGKFNIDPMKNEYASIQLSHERMGLFEVEVDHAVKNAGGAVENVRKVGLVGPTGNVLIEPKYAYIENPREGLYRGITHAQGDYSAVIEQSSFYDVAYAKAADGFGSGARVTGSDPLSTSVDAVLSANNVRTKIKGMEKAIDPFRRTLDSVTVSKFFSGSSEVFGEGKLSFPSYVAMNSLKGVSTKREVFEIFDQYSKERAIDFIRNYAETEHRGLSRLEIVRVQRKFQDEMKAALEDQFRLAFAGKNATGDRFLAETVQMYLDSSAQRNKHYGRTLLRAA